MAETVRGEIERITFHNPENGFVVMKVRAERPRGELVTVVGTLTVPRAGEALEASGRWLIDREFGKQFRAETIRTESPRTAAGLQKYLASGVIRGVGPAIAKKIVALYGERTVQILDDHPDLLLHLKGIGQNKLTRIVASWQEQKAVRQIMLFLHEHGVGTARAVQIYRQYGRDSIAVIQKNPYQLADDIRGIGFKTADELAGRLGLDRRSPLRIRAAVRHGMHLLSEEGHVGYPFAGAVDHACRTLDLDVLDVEQAIDRLLAEKELVRETVRGDDWLFLASLHRSEVGIAESIIRLQTGVHPLHGCDLDAELAKVENDLGFELAAAQREAVREAGRQPVLIVTGGPGVGKTTIVKGILQLFAAKHKACVLAAPTGRAAQRLSETTGRPASTLHRLLEFTPGKGGFLRSPQTPLDGDLFVLDESSMVDVTLAHQFLRAVPKHACLVIVGDVDQLPSVGPGAFLSDLIDSRRVPVIRLTEIFRQAGASRIIQAAYAINSGVVPEFSASREELSDFYFIEAESPDEVQDVLVRLVRDRIPTRFGLDPRKDVQVLAPMNRSQLGVRNLNVILQEILNPPVGGKAKEKDEVGSEGQAFRSGDRVLQKVNNYQRHVFNGDLGSIQKIDSVEQQLIVNFDGRAVEYDFADLHELQLAYAATIHKSQGSEFPCVIVPLHTQHFMMLRRNLLYTAVTRGKKLVVVVGNARALRMAVERKDDAQRFTALAERLRSAAGEESGMYP